MFRTTITLFIAVTAITQSGQEKSPRGVKMIRKCCPENLFLSDWYDCVETENNISTKFRYELGQVGVTQLEIISNNLWRNCPIKNRREYEVINIPEGVDDKAFVFSEAFINYDIGEQNFVGVLEVNFVCLELTEDPQMIIAVVCQEENHINNDGNFVKKCCPQGQALLENFSSCVINEHKWIPPRRIVHHETEQMTGYFALLPGNLCGEDESLQAVKLHSVLTNGMFHPVPANNQEQKKELYQCVDNVVQNTQDTGTPTAIICLRNSCTTQYCVSKCCPEKELFINGKTFCSPAQNASQVWSAEQRLHDQDLNPIPWKTMKNMNVEYRDFFMYNNIWYRHRIPNCDKVIIMDNSNNEFIVLHNGSLYHKDKGLTNNFCVDNTIDMNGNVVEIVLICESSEEISSTDTIGDGNSCLGPYLSLLRLLNTLSGLISCVFLIITFLVYTFVPELNNLHGKIILSNVLSIFLLTAYLLVVYNFTNYLSPLTCQIVGYSGYFFTMSMFTWMTVMSGDLCWTFLRAKLPRRGSAMLKYILYSVAAWGSSAVLTLGIVVADQVWQDSPENTYLFIAKPNVGKTKCFLEDEPQGIFLHLPILILMLTNGVFFMVTTSTLHRSSMTTHQARNARQKTRRQAVNTVSRINQETKEQLVLLIPHSFTKSKFPCYSRCSTANYSL